MTDWDGLPEHPERDGWHWFGKGIAATPCYWNAKMEWWSIPFDHSPQTPFMMKNRGREYIGPVLTPAEAAALYAAGARAGIETALNVAATHIEVIGDYAADRRAEDIRALDVPLPVMPSPA